MIIIIIGVFLSIVIMLSIVFFICISFIKVYKLLFYMYIYIN